jgi:hypothetical protein
VRRAQNDTRDSSCAETGPIIKNIDTVMSKNECGCVLLAAAETHELAAVPKQAESVAGLVTVRNPA